MQANHSSFSKEKDIIGHVYYYKLYIYIFIYIYIAHPPPRAPP